MIIWMGCKIYNAFRLFAAGIPNSSNSKDWY